MDRAEMSHLLDSSHPSAQDPSMEINYSRKTRGKLGALGFYLLMQRRTDSTGGARTRTARDLGN